MKIALIGFGNMGKAVYEIAEKQKQFSIVSISFKNRTDTLHLSEIKKADVAIDFTSSDIVVGNIRKISALGVPMVIGTTGWYDQMDEVKKIISKQNSGLIYGQNFSIGANIFFKIIAFSATLMNNFPFYDAYGLEIHHKRKKDSPSGTAKKISSIISQVGQREFHFSSVRAGENPGFHEVVFDSVADEIHLSHQAHTREGFAKGALFAAEFIVGKKGIFSFDEAFEREVKRNEKI